MKSSFSRAHIIFIISGIILSVTAIALSYIDSLASSSFNPWTMESSYYTRGFYPKTFLFFGTFEILLLFWKHSFTRISAIIPSIMKTVLPWLTIIVFNSLYDTIYDIGATKITVTNSVPIIITVISSLSIVHSIAMAVVLIRERKRDKLSQLCKGGAKCQS